MKRIIREKSLRSYEDYLKNGEKSKATVRKYLCDLGSLWLMQMEKRSTRN